MAQLVGLIVSADSAFTHHIGHLLRSGAIPVSLTDAREGALPDLAIVDARGDMSSAMSAIERLRAAAPGAGIFVVALTSEPDAILQAMRAGANEFFVWPPPEDTFHAAIRRTATRRESAHGARPNATTLVFFGAKGGAGTTTVAVNCGVEIARLSRRPTVIVDLASDTQEFVDRLLEGDATAGDKLVQIGDTAITVLAGIFPGPITAELKGVVFVTAVVTLFFFLFPGPVVSGAEAAASALFVR